MVVWRLTKRRNADLSGRCGEIAAGRWHDQGRPIVYCASTAALAVLEVRVHLDLTETPSDYVLMKIAVPAAVSARTLEAAELPAGWRDLDGVHLCRPIGDAWLQERSTALLIVPSAILEIEYNLLINPQHPDAGKLSVAASSPSRGTTASGEW